MRFYFGLGEPEPSVSGPEDERVYAAAEGGRATREITEATGLSEEEVIGSLQRLVAAGRIVGVPRQAPWFVFWAWTAPSSAPRPEGK